MNEYLHLMPSSRARLGSLPWALCVRTLHRPFRSSRHRDISFNRGPASFRQDPGVTFSVSSSGRLWFCGDKNTERKTRSRVNQDRAFQGNIQSLILNYGSTMKPRLVTFATGDLREWLFSPSNAITDTKNMSEVWFHHFFTLQCGKNFQSLDRNVDD